MVAQTETRFELSAFKKRSYYSSTKYITTSSNSSTTLVSVLLEYRAEGGLHNTPE